MLAETIVRRRLAPRDYVLRRLLVASDLVALLISSLVLALLVTREPFGETFGLALTTLPVWSVLFSAYQLYANDSRRIGHTTVDDVPAIFHSFLVGVVGMWLYFDLVSSSKLVFIDLLEFAVLGAGAMLALRAGVRFVAHRCLRPERVLIVGSCPVAPRLVERMRTGRRYGLVAVGALSRIENRTWPLDVPDLGELTSMDIDDVLQEQRIDRVIWCGPEGGDDDVMDFVHACRRRGVKVSTLPTVASILGPAALVDQLDGITLLGANAPVLPRSSASLKRVIDIVGAAVGLIAAAPVAIVLAVAIKLDSPGPVFFRQLRVGRRGKHFRCVKFRTMIADAEARRATLLAQSRSSKWLDVEEDPRITRVGRLLRHTSIDEIPQLWNVLRGHMSLVGPRPLPVVEDANIQGWARHRLDLTPGITGPWQVLGRRNIPFEEMVKLDYLYVTNWSLWSDLRLLIWTLPAVMLRRGVN